MSYIIRSLLSGPAVVEPAASHRITSWWPTAMGMSVAAIISLVLAKLRPHETLEIATAFSQLHHPAITAVIVAAATILIAFLAGLSAVFALLRTLHPKHLQAAALGAWAGPLALHVAAYTPLLVLAAVLLAPALARTVASAGPDPEDRQMFDMLAPGDGGILRTFGATLALQVAAIAIGNYYFATASLLVAIGVAVIRRVSWRRRSVRPRPRFASLLMGAVLFAFLGNVRWSGAGDAFPRAGQEQNTKPDTNLGGDHVGLFIYPKAERIVTLVPPLPSLRAGPFSGLKDNPLRVPFYGIYSYFRWPDQAPPAGSFRGEGEPELMGLRSMDGRPIRMEARQNFGQLIDLRCCSRIQLEVRNNDRYPDTVRMELLVRNSFTPKRPMVSLRRQELRSRFRLYDDRKIAKETLDYAVPGGAPPFDEAVVLFHLQRSRQTRAARVAIEAFVFVPRR